MLAYKKNIHSIVKFCGNVCCVGFVAIQEGTKFRLMIDIGDRLEVAQSGKKVYLPLFEMVWTCLMKTSRGTCA